jgi:hypothetical protein
MTGTHIECFEIECSTPPTTPTCLGLVTGRLSYSYLRMLVFPGGYVRTYVQIVCEYPCLLTYLERVLEYVRVG